MGKGEERRRFSKQTHVSAVHSWQEIRNIVIVTKESPCLSQNEIRKFR